jgi:hypothetical protein
MSAGGNDILWKRHLETSADSPRSWAKFAIFATTFSFGVHIFRQLQVACERGAPEEEKSARSHGHGHLVE